jgi:hypothetical protein
VRDLYRRLKGEGFSPWLDEVELLPGQDWRDEIPKAVYRSDVVIVCLSRGSVNKEGYVQREIRVAIDAADEKPEGTIFVVPLKLEECEVPSRLSRWQWASLFEEGGYQRLVRALATRANTIGAGVVPAPVGAINELPPHQQGALLDSLALQRSTRAEHVLLGLVGLAVIVGAVWYLSRSGTKQGVRRTDQTQEVQQPRMTADLTGLAGSGARTVMVAANRPWTATGMILNQGDEVTIAATGIITTNLNGATASPAGTGPDCSAAGQVRVPFVAPRLPCQSLLGRVGRSGEVFEVGRSTRLKSPATGELFLGVNDNWFPDNSGSWNATVAVTVPRR